MSNRDTHALYRFYDATGQLLYVGITADPGSRWRSHAHDKPWWHEVRGISMEPYDTRDEVLAAERRAIAVENPRYNKSRPSLPRTKRATQATVRSLVWICNGCGKPVADDHGYVHIEHQAVYDVERATRRWEADNPGPYISGGALLDYPGPAHWAVHHAECDPDPGSSDYHFDVSRVRTHAALLTTTAHLMGKSWLEHTDWDDLIRRMAQVAP